MDEKDIRKYAALMRELGLTGLEFNENGSSVRLEMTPAEPAFTRLVKEEAAAAEDARLAAGEVLSGRQQGLIDITSPMVGVFYSAPAENAAPFVQVGDTVKKGDILCIIEAMKLMNEIVSDQDGVIAEICVGNEQIVDYGHVLFRLRKN
jgi:acetyl-CoA carboxylase biotin carboxyl carrier protein